MHIDPTSNTSEHNYKLLTNLVVPRPIAWITSLGPHGLVNLAPFSFFNAVGSDPVCVLVSIGRRDSGAPKDTARNILDRGEFVVNMVTEELLEAMNISAVAFPPDQSELTAAHLHTAAALRVHTPRLAEAQVSLECRLAHTQVLGANTLLIGEVVMFHVADRLLGPRQHVQDFAPIGRLGSPSVYCRTTERFELAPISHAQWLAQHPT